MKRAITISLLFSLLAGCSTLTQTTTQKLDPFVGAWANTGPQPPPIIDFELTVEQTGRFQLHVVAHGAERTEQTVAGTCRVDDGKLLLRVESSRMPLEDRMPFEVYATLKQEMLVLHDDPRDPERTTRYKRVQNDDPMRTMH